MKIISALIGAAILAAGCKAKSQDSTQSPPVAAVEKPAADVDGGHSAGPSVDQRFRYPSFELAGDLKDIFEVKDCEYISGMTCRIHYKGVRPLPSQVFFTEFDEQGRQAGPAVRLLYPRLQPGETGYGTFRIRSSSPAKVVLRGEWKGPWRNPY